MAVEPLFRPYTTYEDLCRLPSDGQRYELIAGEVYMAASYTSFATPPPGCAHQRLVGRLLVVFAEAIQDRSEIFAGPLDVVLDLATCLQPDLLLVQESRLGILEDVVRGAPDLVVEVLSPATVERDRTVKVQLYARHSVAEYWIVDPEVQKIEILRLDPGKKAYRLAATLRPGDRATTPLLSALSIDVTALFRS